jgi:hypothetical protein
MALLESLAHSGFGSALVLCRANLYLAVELFAVAETGTGFPLKREAVRDSFASFALLTLFRMTE